MITLHSRLNIKFTKKKLPQHKLSTAHRENYLVINDGFRNLEIVDGLLKSFTKLALQASSSILIFETNIRFAFIIIFYI